MCDWFLNVMSCCKSTHLHFNRQNIYRCKFVVSTSKYNIVRKRPLEVQRRFQNLIVELFEILSMEILLLRWGSAEKNWTF